MICNNNNYLYKCAANNNQHLDIILSLRDILPIELLYNIVLIYLNLFKSTYLHVIHNDLIFRLKITYIF